jgi:hypothetical protein
MILAGGKIEIQEKLRLAIFILEETLQFLYPLRINSRKTMFSSKCPRSDAEPATSKFLSPVSTR